MCPRTCPSPCTGRPPPTTAPRQSACVTVLSPIPLSVPLCVALGTAVAVVVVAVRGRANVPQEATQQIQSRYHRHQGRGNEERKPERTMVVGMPRDDGEQHGGQEQDEVAPVLGEVTDPPLSLPTLLCGHDEVVDVLCDDLLKCGSTGDLVFRNPLQQVQFRFDDGSQVRPFARHPAEQGATGQRCCAQCESFQTRHGSGPPSITPLAP